MGETRRGIVCQGRPFAMFNNAPILQNQDFVGTLNRCQPVGDDDGGASMQQLADRPLDQLLGGRVEPRGGFVEDNQVGVRQEDSRERQQLRFARRQAFSV